MPKFEWNEDKNKSNQRKHHVSFERGTETFDDPNGVFLVADSKNELRFMRIGKTAARVLLTVVFTLRNTIVRIISVRSPRKREVRTYLENSLKKQDDADN